MKFATLFKKIRTVLTRNKTKKGPARIKPVPHDFAADPEGERDHTHDDDMGSFEYWHGKLTGYRPLPWVGGMDGKRQTLDFRHDLARRQKSYERRRSERKAAKAAAQAAKEGQEEAEKRWSQPGVIDPKPKQKRHVADLLPTRQSEAAPTQAEILKTKTMSYGLEEDKLDMGQEDERIEWNGHSAAKMKEDIEGRHELPAAPTHALRTTTSQYHDAEEEPRSKRWNDSTAVQC